ncbi:hypothetical protein AQPE_2219 [Aquipluma nitroreducens]|uniref:Uncharacterized protein n=1 Tax=Aquipluma nitroreducens TaxID=2010828 RepID=A0A5K7S9A5_9BACT|nr:hypothetical protein [Aquipluma nitroreducens]BBE18059.1 hypothetical protein AQPE_2219 [Aquipluma nitroreducens]
MKKRNLFVQVMLVVFTLISINVWAGDEGSLNSTYKISPDLNFNPTSSFQKSWEIAYGESKTPVHVFMKETKKGQEYLVRTKYFEVKYVNGSTGFGARAVSETDRTVSEALNDAVLNQKQLLSQKCISTESIANDQVLEMIASYLPDLINEQYNSILN